jgi:hypothetical protein
MGKYEKKKAGNYHLKKLVADSDGAITYHSETGSSHYLEYSRTPYPSPTSATKSQKIARRALRAIASQYQKKAWPSNKEDLISAAKLPGPQLKVALQVWKADGCVTGKGTKKRPYIWDKKCVHEAFARSREAKKTPLSASPLEEIRKPKPSNDGSSGAAGVATEKAMADAKKALRKKLVAFYTKHNPEGLGKVQALVAKHWSAPQQKELFKALQTKYGDSLLNAEANGTISAAAAAGAGGAHGLVPSQQPAPLTPQQHMRMLEQHEAQMQLQQQQQKQTQEVPFGRGRGRGRGRGGRGIGRGSTAGVGGGGSVGGGGGLQPRANASVPLEDLVELNRTDCDGGGDNGSGGGGGVGRGSDDTRTSGAPRVNLLTSDSQLPGRPRHPLELMRASQQADLAALYEADCTTIARAQRITVAGPVHYFINFLGN